MKAAQRVLTGIAAIAIGGLALSACASGSGESTSTPKEPESLTMWARSSTQDYTQAIDQAHELKQLAATRDAPAWLAAQADRITQVYQVLWRSRMNLAVNRKTGKPAP